MSEKQYTEIDLDNIDAKSADDLIEVEFDDENDEYTSTDGEEELEETTDEEDEEEEDGSSLDDDEDEEGARKPAKKDDPKKKGSRAEKRIRTLANQKKELEARLKEAERRYQEQQEQYAKSTKSSTESKIKLLGDTVNDLRFKMSKALENGEYDIHAELNEKLNQAILDRRIAEYELNNVPAQRQTAQNNQQNQQNQYATQAQVPEAAQKWAEKNDWFTDPVDRTERKKQRAAINISSELINQEGYDPTSEEFYEELDARLEEAFGAESQEDDTSSETNQQRTPPKQKPTVAGSGRGVPARKARNTRKVVLTKEDREAIEELGIDPKEYAKNKAKYKDNGYTEIF